MKNKVVYLIGAILIILIVSFVGYLSYISAKENYRKELKNVIDNKYLEGKQEIGAYDLKFNDLTLYKASSINDVIGSMLSVSDFGWWKGVGTFSNRNIISLVNSKENNYEWINLNLDSGYPFFVVVRKTERGYDVIGEYIVGIGIKYGFPKVFIKSDYSKEDIDSYSINIAPDLAEDYVIYLFGDKYKNCLVRNERENNNLMSFSLDKFGRSHDNPKMKMLEELITKMSCKIDESLFFRTNKYFELKYDNYFTEIGSGPITWFDNTYGNEMQNLFTRTVTLHYSIQETKGVLEYEYKNLFMKIGIISLILYSLIIILFNKRKGGGK